MKLALDTSYFMYGFGLSPKPEIPQTVLDMFVENSNITEIIFSDLVIFELNAKASKKLPECIDLDSRSESLIKLEQTTKFKMIKSSNSAIWEIACFLRKFHKDFVDCVHWATAIEEGVQIFVTEDEIIEKISKRDDFKKEFTNKFKKELPLITNFIKWSKVIN